MGRHPPAPRDPRGCVVCGCPDPPPVSTAYANQHSRAGVPACPGARAASAADRRMRRLGVARRLARRDGGWSCAYCGTEVLVGGYNIDHVVPSSRGGSDDLDNKVLSCGPCNRSKYNRTPEEWPARPC